MYIPDPPCCRACRLYLFLLMLLLHEATWPALPYLVLLLLLMLLHVSSHEAGGCLACSPLVVVAAASPRVSRGCLACSPLLVVVVAASLRVFSRGGPACSPLVVVVAAALPWGGALPYRGPLCARPSTSRIAIYPLPALHYIPIL